MPIGRLAQVKDLTAVFKRILCPGKILQNISSNVAVGVSGTADVHQCGSLEHRFLVPINQHFCYCLFKKRKKKVLAPSLLTDKKGNQCVRLNERSLTT